MPQKTLVEKMITSVGSGYSLILHTLIFLFFFLFASLGFFSWDTMLLVLTTLVSLEAIYLAIFIQMSVNRHAVELAEVSEDVEDIQEDIEEISDETEEEQHEKRQTVALEQLTKDLQRVLADLEQLKKG